MATAEVRPPEPRPASDGAQLATARGGLFRAAALRRYRLGRDGAPPSQVLPRGLSVLLAPPRRQRVPVVLQMGSAECGAACLAMILGYHGRAASLDACRAVCAGGRDGLTTAAIARAARSFGLRTTGYRVEPRDFGHLMLPAIAHWNFNHFVVVEHWSPAAVRIVDPAVGRRTVTAADFDAAFTGVVLTFEPGPDFMPREERAVSPWRRYLGEVTRAPQARPLLAWILLASLALQVLGLAVPILTGYLVDHVLPARRLDLLSMLGLGVVLIGCSQALLNYLRARLVLHLRAVLDRRLMLGFFQHLLDLPFGFFQGRRTGELAARLAGNAIVRETLTNQSLAAVLDGALILVYLGVLVVQSPRFAGVVVALGALQVVCVLTARRALGSVVRHDLLTQAAAQGYLVEALRGIALLKASGSEHRALEQWTSLFHEQMAVTLQRGRLTARVEAGLAALRAAAPLLLLWCGALWVLQGNLSLGTMLALNALAAAALLPLGSLLALGQQLLVAGAHLERLGDVLETPPEQSAKAIRSVPRPTGRIEVRDLNFRYAPQAPLVLHDISFSIAPGQKVALVGRTGSGKSTLARLLLGLYPPSAGEILYDGVPLQALDRRALRQQCGVVLQEPHLFAATIRQNIAFHDPGLSLEQVQEAARLAAIHDDIQALPMGYDTLVAEGGAALSGGQRQRVEIARALTRRPAVLILDEATSHLDPLSEQVVDGNLQGLDCTRVVIAHRLSTVRNADLILVFAQGRIVERGTHASLMALRGEYAALVEGQEGARERRQAPALSA
jgi:ABC-type bacteriocin/lantibiotic exporter with double-glycine peptidase domain